MWTPWYIAAFVFGIICIILTIFCFLFPSRKITLIIRFAFDVAAVMSGICVYFSSHLNEMWAIVAVDGISLVRDIIYLYKGKYKWATSIWWFIGFEVVFACSLIFTWAGPISLLPVFGSLINNAGFYQTDVKKTKIIILFGQTCFITYYALLIAGSELLTLLNMISSSLFFISAVIGLIILYKTKKENIVTDEKETKEAK